MLSDDEISELYERFGHVIFRRCRRILGDEEEARDALQEVFASALRYRKTFLRRSPPEHWLQRVTTNHCLRRLEQLSRRPAARPVDEDRAPAPMGEPALDPRGDAARRDLVLRLLTHFDERTRAIVVCTFIEGRLQHETAELMGISTRAVRKRLAGFKQQAREIVKQLEADHERADQADAGATARREAR